MTANALYVGAVGKAFRVLDCFKNSSGDLSLTEIIERSGLDKSAAQRYAYTLSVEGYLAQNPHTRRYRLGPNVLDLTFHFMRTNALAETLNPILLELSHVTKQKISMSIRDGRWLVHVLRHQTSTEHYHASLVGRRIPLHCTAGGRSVMSRLDETEVANLLACENLVACTPNTLTTAKAIRSELKKARDRGYAAVVDEFIVGEVALACAVLDARGVPLGAVHVSGSSCTWGAEDYAKKFSPFLLKAIAQYEHRNA